MSPRVLAIMAIAMLLQAPGAVSQDDESNVAYVADPEGDPVFEPDDATTDANQEAARRVDVVGLTIGPDSATSISMALDFLDLDSGLEDGQDAPRRYERIDFEIDGSFFSVYPEDHYCDSFALFHIIESSASDRLIDCVNADQDYAANQILFDIPKQWLVSSDGAPIAAGQSIEGVHAIVTEIIARARTPDNDEPKVQYTVTDRAPDQNGLTLALQAGGSSSNPNGLRAAIQTPLRATNGAATTFQFDVTLSNLGDADRTLVPSVSGLWEGAKIYAKPELVIGAGQVRQEPVYVEIPFGHEHGKTSWASVRFTDIKDQSWSEVDIGVHWLTIPQPAGHHPMLWFHSSAEDDASEAAAEVEDRPVDYVLYQGGVWMNAAEIDPSPAADDSPVTSVAARGGGNFLQGEEYSYAYWNAKLSPELELGLNFTPGGMSLLQASFDQLALGNEQVVSASMAVCTFDVGSERTPNDNWSGSYDCRGGTISEIASGTSEPASVDTDGSMTFSVPLQHIEDRELVPYHPSNNLVLSIELRQEPGGGRTREDAARLVVSQSNIMLDIGEYDEASPLTATSLAELGDVQNIEEIPAEGTVNEQEAPNIPIGLVLVTMATIAIRLRRR